MIEHDAVATGKRPAHLVESADGCDEDDSICIIKVWYPGVSLSTSASHIVKMPCDVLAMEIHVERVLCHSHCLYSGVEDIILTQSQCTRMIG